MIDKIPVIVTVSRETGQIIQVETGEVKEQDFQRICSAMITRGRGSGKSPIQTIIREEGERICQDGKRTE